LREDVHRSVRVILDFFSQRTYINPEVLQFILIEKSPHVVQQELVGQELSFVGRSEHPDPRQSTLNVTLGEDSHQALPLEDGEVLITTPMLGTFYRSPKPGEPQFVEVGDKIDAEAVVGIVEVMKLMSSIPAGVAGEVTRVLAHDGQLVEADQPLFAVRASE